MWCVLVHDASQMAANVVTIGPYRSREKASKVAAQINRKIEIHGPAHDEDGNDGESGAWVQEMRSKVTEVYDALGIRSLR